MYGQLNITVVGHKCWNKKYEGIVLHKNVIKI